MPIPQITAIARIVKYLEDNKKINPFIVFNKTGKPSVEVVLRISAWCLKYIMENSE
jgi:hypothetical protein